MIVSWDPSEVGGTLERRSVITRARFPLMHRRRLIYLTLALECSELMRDLNVSVILEGALSFSHYDPRRKAAVSSAVLLRRRNPALGSLRFWSLVRSLCKGYISPYFSVLNIFISLETCSIRQRAPCVF
jgi:hypothetical protein